MKSLRARLALALLGLLALAGYLVVVDLGMHAGRVHRGVNVSGFDVGGLTEIEAFDALRERQQLLAETPVVFIANGFDCRALPADPEGVEDESVPDLGWSPQPFNTAQDAMEVGRGGLLAGLRERIDAWLGGYRIGWAGTVDPAKVDDFLDYCEENAAVVDATIDRPKLRFRIRRAIVTYPRSAIQFKVPLERRPG
ncbi:MAG TPA: hypothetical protein VHN37_02495 [Actinomycetota bacterium]|nr:hypothetical protein [Actinomycetota bacterium]